MEYAAKDALVSVDIFFKLYRLHLAVNTGSESGVGLCEWVSGLLDHEREKRGKRNGLRHSKPGDVPAAQPSGHAGEEGADAECRFGIGKLTERLDALGLAGSYNFVSEASSSSYLGSSLAVKSLALFLNDKPVVVVLPSDCKLDYFKLARRMKLVLSSRKAVSKQVTPFCLREQFTVFVACRHVTNSPQPACISTCGVASQHIWLRHTDQIGRSCRLYRCVRFRSGHGSSHRSSIKAASCYRLGERNS